MKTAYRYNIGSTLIVPFRCGLNESIFKSKFPSEDFATEIKIFYRDSIDLGMGVTSIPLQTKICTIIEIQTELIHGLEKEEAKEWTRNNQNKIIEGIILPKVNHFFNHLKHQRPDPVLTGVIRTIGTIDLLFINLSFENEVIYSRGISTLVSAIIFPSQLKFAGSVGPFSADLDLSINLPKEWLILTRATDLINHGYYVESIIIGYSLLEECANRFLLQNIPNLNSEEAGKFLQMIERRRLKAYFGCITKLCFGTAIIEDKSLKEDLKWLVEKRNGIIHQGNECSKNDAKRGLEIVHSIMKKMNNYRETFSIPDSLAFW